MKINALIEFVVLEVALAVILILACLWTNNIIASAVYETIAGIIMGLVGLIYYAEVNDKC